MSPFDELRGTPRWETESGGWVTAMRMDRGVNIFRYVE